MTITVFATPTSVQELPGPVSKENETPYLSKIPLVYHYMHKWAPYNRAADGLIFKFTCEENNELQFNALVSFFEKHPQMVPHNTLLTLSVTLTNVDTPKRTVAIQGKGIIDDGVPTTARKMETLLKEEEDTAQKEANKLISNLEKLERDENSIFPPQFITEWRNFFSKITFDTSLTELSKPLSKPNDSSPLDRWILNTIYEWNDIRNTSQSNAHMVTKLMKTLKTLLETPTTNNINIFKTFVDGHTTRSLTPWTRALIAVIIVACCAAIVVSALALGGTLALPFGKLALDAIIAVASTTTAGILVKVSCKVRKNKSCFFKEGSASQALIDEITSLQPQPPATN